MWAFLNLLLCLFDVFVRSSVRLFVCLFVCCIVSFVTFISYFFYFFWSDPVLQNVQEFPKFSDGVK